MVSVTVFATSTFLSENTPVEEIVISSPSTHPLAPLESTTTEVNPSYTLFDAVIPVTVTGFAVMSAVVLA